MDFPCQRRVGHEWCAIVVCTISEFALNVMSLGQIVHVYRLKLRLRDVVESQYDV